MDAPVLVLVSVAVVGFLAAVLIGLDTLGIDLIGDFRKAFMRKLRLLWSFLKPADLTSWSEVLFMLVVLMLVGLPVWLGLVAIANGLSKL